MNMFQFPPSPGSTGWSTPMFDPASWQSMMQSPQFNTSQFATTIKELGARLDPAEVGGLQQEYMLEMSSLWRDMLASKMPTMTDRRFSSPEWQANPLHVFNAAAYLLNARFLTRLGEAVEASPHIKRKINFAISQMIDAMSPANFLASNPEAQKKLTETKGESLTKGMAQLLEDVQKGRISQSDETAFEVGRNVATTEGAVVFENEIFQLLQYKPLTKTVHERPLLIVPPCINKYYILDLQPENSLVRYAVEQGHTVFLVSWCNPDARLGHLGWDDYLERGAIKAIQVAQAISGRDQINALGFCVGGTILSSALAVLFGRGEKPVSSLTLLTTFLDFSDTGVIDVFVDEAQVAMREQTIGGGGLMPGRDFNSAFASLRPNDLVWNYVRSNYLKGEAPPAFDLLYWNGDSTNLPGPMFCYYLRNMYLENNLVKPGKLSMRGEPIDLSKIDTPSFIYGSREDHIVPWSSAFASVSLLNPKKPSRNKFVLGASGHIAGVINAPAKNKRSHWVNEAQANSAEAWLEGAEERPGSWWPEWADFLASHAGKKVAAPKRLGNTQYQPIEDAPGRYVKVKQLK